MLEKIQSVHLPNNHVNENNWHVQVTWTTRSYLHDLGGNIFLLSGSAKSVLKGETSRVILEPKTMTTKKKKAHQQRRKLRMHPQTS